ncbi:MAG: prolipoprotein diacylglyceryl transferase, partial [Bacteroidetes bacterium]
PWGTDYSNGTYPPSAAFRQFPDIVAKYGINGVVPDDTLCHPTPVYETLICAAFFFVLWKNRTRWSAEGKVFYAYLVLAGLERFSVEFLRLNERILAGLSEAQVIALILIAIGAAGLNSLHRNARSSSAGTEKL